MPKKLIDRLSSKDLDKAIELKDRIWWVGTYLDDDAFQCHAYLIENNDSSVLIDPGGLITFKEVLRKVESIVPISHVRYFICHHQDPDITASLTLLDGMARKDAVVVTHWRAIALLKHYGLSLKFLDIEEAGWELDIGGRLLSFVFTPYLHFPGAFCTYDQTSKVLFSSDLFGGMTSDWSLVAKDESYFEDVRPFHEHYMPSSDILQSGLMKIEELDIDLIAPQHGSIIPKNLIRFMIGKLKQVDCGLYALAKDDTDIRRLSTLNRTLRDITSTLVMYRDFRDIVEALLKIFRRDLPITSIEFYAKADDGSVMGFTPETRYRGASVEIKGIEDLFEVKKDSWPAKDARIERNIPLPARSPSAMSGAKTALAVPLFSHHDTVARAVAVLRLAHQLELTRTTERILEQVSQTLGVAVEREMLLRLLDDERTRLYEQSIKDPLTGLYNRFYMDETIRRLMYLQDRNDKDTIGAILFDIDHFKRINDEHGHSVGDEVLRSTGKLIASCTRGGDVPVRYGGEEFAVFLVGYGANECLKTAERIRKKVEGALIEGANGKLTVTISAGVAVRAREEPLARLLSRADEALYRAKREGRNRVVLA